MLATFVHSDKQNAALPEDEPIVPPKIPSRSGLTLRIPSNRLSLEKELKDAQLSLLDVAAAFEKGVKLQDRIYHLKTYKDAFTGSQAVKFFVKKGFCSTKQDAILLGRLLMEELYLFEHVGGVEKELWDCPLTLYQFLPAEERKARNDLKLQKEEEREAQVQKASDDVSTLIESLPDEDTTKNLSNVDSELLEIADIFRQGIKIRHNRHRGKVYRNSFIGSQAVDFLVNSSLAKNRREAVELGRRLKDEINLFDHVTRSHPFSDDFLFYRLEAHCTQNNGKHQCSVSNFMGQVQDSVSSLTNFGMGKQGLRDSYITQPIQSDTISGGTDFLPLEEIAREFRKNVEIKDRRYHFSMYRDVFVGSDAVDYLVGRTQWASSRREAVQVGQSLMRELDLFRHVTEGQPFADDYYFYKFTDEDEESMLQRLEILFSKADLPFVDQSGSTKPEKLASVARALEVGLQPKSHTYRFRVYNDTLVGSEIVSFIVENKLASTRGEALHVGRAIAKHFKLFEHVTMDHLLKDSNVSRGPPSPRAERFAYSS